ncbi:PREDICTED: nijmegen breakage syndrome 1 protein isoform X1 [Camelina sativa]|uniref:Nijmegen breakage syndrome 1 protein isoform X1 n=1 Tax=Camelina sativa TaxID=90675 RepID=A0ABM1RCY1_CAMSA|nr:PREDICTED: nijmegen breakage syndrome 1 protein isoform X1 [Camelina sativa]
MVWGLFPVDPLSGEDKYYIFTKGIYKIGRKGCDIIINKDKGVSRIHAELTFDATTVSTSRRNKSSDETSSFVIRVKDCSKYGTFVKTDLGPKEKVHELPDKEKILKDGDVITFGTGSATYRFSLVPLVFYFCPSSETFKVDQSVQDAVSSIGAHVSPTLSEECTHVLLEPRMQVNEALVKAILAKKPIILTNWVKLLAEKRICSEIPGYSQYRPSVMIEEALVDVVELNVREKCLEGFTFVLEPVDMYIFGCSFPSLLKVCGAETVTIADISSMSQDSQYGEINRIICVIPKSSGDKFGRLKHLSLLSRVNEMDLVCAVFSGNLSSTSLILPSVVISSSCSTDETVVADSDAEEEETTSSVHMIDATEKAETPEKPAAIIIEDSPVTILEETMNLNDFKTVNLLADTENRGLIDEKNSGDSVTIRRDRNDEAETGNSEIIYTQDLIVRDLRPTRKVHSTGEEGVVDFKRFRKGNVTCRNSFGSLIPFAKDPYKEYDSGDVTDFMKEEKKRKQMEAIAEDLFNTEKARKRGTAGSIRGFLTRG